MTADDPKPNPPANGDHERFPSRTVGDPADARDFAIDAARMLLDDKCTEIVVLDVRGLSQVTDFLVVGSGTSDRQMRSTLDDVGKLAKARGRSTFRTNADERATWLLADFVDIVVHLFEPETRAVYDLEMLWGDADKVDWMRPGDAAKNSPGFSGDSEPS
jgi:ribosome-associated protein